MIDVLMSVYNAEKYLPAAIQSVLDQTVKDFTFYVVDDASTDHSAEIIKSFKDERIVFLQNRKNKGLTKNLNFLLRRGKGKYVARQDADDVSWPERFREQIDFLQQGHFDLVGCSEKNKYNNNNLKKDLIKFNMFIHSSWFGKRKIFEELNGYDENYPYSQDYDFLLRAVNKYKLGVISEKLVILKHDKNSVSLKNLKEQQYFALRARWSAIKRGDYSPFCGIYLLKPIISYLLPKQINEIIYQKFYGYKTN